MGAQGQVILNFQHDHCERCSPVPMCACGMKAPLAAAFFGGKHSAAAIGMTMIATGKPHSGGYRLRWAASMTAAVVFIKKRQTPPNVLSVTGNLLRLEIRTWHTTLVWQADLKPCLSSGSLQTFSAD